MERERANSFGAARGFSPPPSHPSRPIHRLKETTESNLPSRQTERQTSGGLIRIRQIHWLSQSVSKVESAGITGLICLLFSVLETFIVSDLFFCKNLLTGLCVRSSGLREATDMQSAHFALFSKLKWRGAELLLANSLSLGAEITICMWS